MKTIVSSAGKKVIIGDGHPTVLIGERINPSGRRRLSKALKAGDLGLVREEALSQVKSGANMLDVNVLVSGVDETALLPEAVQMVMETVDAPICIDSNNPRAIEAAIRLYKGKPLINSANGGERSLKEVLPLAKEYDAAVIGLTMDDQGIPKDADGRLRLSSKIVEQAELIGIPREDIVIDCLAMAVGADSSAGKVTFEAIRRIKAELGVNMTLGTSNISFGMPDRQLLNWAFLVVAIAAGVNCPIVDVAEVRQIVLATDLSLGLDDYGTRYIKGYRERQNE
jgi:5-methyltetrahydrofolate--homocysteine methyltransferase